MNLYQQIYEFAASAGAFEGYVYGRRDLDMNALPNWIANLNQAYALIPREILDQIQPSIDQTLGRAWRSASQVLGEDHELVAKLGAMIKGSAPDSSDAFRKDKWFQDRNRKS